MFCAQCRQNTATLFDTLSQHVFCSEPCFDAFIGMKRARVVVPTSRVEAAFTAIRQNNLGALVELVSSGVVGVNARTARGHTLLMVAVTLTAAHGNDIVDFLLAHPELDVNAQDARGVGATALMIACGDAGFSTRVDTVYRLLEHPNINVNARDHDGTTAIMYPFYTHMEDLTIVLELLRRPDVDINVENETGDTLLSLALAGWSNDNMIVVDVLFDRPDFDIALIDRLVDIRKRFDMWMRWVTHNLQLSHDSARILIGTIILYSIHDRAALSNLLGVLGVSEQFLQEWSERRIGIKFLRSAVLTVLNMTEWNEKTFFHLFYYTNQYETTPMAIFEQLSRRYGFGNIVARELGAASLARRGAWLRLRAYIENKFD